MKLTTQSLKEYVDKELQKLKDYIDSRTQPFHDFLVGQQAIAKAQKKGGKLTFQDAWDVVKWLVLIIAAIVGAKLS